MTDAAVLDRNDNWDHHDTPSEAASQHKAGQKLDFGKMPIHSLFMDYFPRAIAAVAMVSEYGARKYTPKGWLSVPDGVVRYTDADVRHLQLEGTEGAYDVGDSGLAHAAQHAWNALARLELMIREGKVNIMRGNAIGPDNKPILDTATVVKF